MPAMAQPSNQSPVVPAVAWKGRAALTNRESRFNRYQHEADPDSDGADRTQGEAAPRTRIAIEVARSIISTNDSPDVPFDHSINPYRGCEHGCVYCYARPSHAYLGLSPGLDFETRIFAKTNAAELLRQELSRPGHVRSVIALGANTDPYQPIERRLRITRSLLQVLGEFEHPLSITTKSTLVTRDIDLLAPMAGKALVSVQLSLCTLDREIARTLEPRANAPQRRLQAIAQLAAAGIPTGVIVAPIVPALTDRDLEHVLQAAAEAGARHASYVVLRLPREVGDLFVQWLERHQPLRARHVMSLVQQMRGGQRNDSSFGDRMRGSGLFADLIARRFAVACKRLGLNTARALAPPPGAAPAQADPPTRRAPASPQMSLFG